MFAGGETEACSREVMFEQRPSFRQGASQVDIWGRVLWQRAQCTGSGWVGPARGCWGEGQVEAAWAGWSCGSGWAGLFWS